MQRYIIISNLILFRTINQIIQYIHQITSLDLQYMSCINSQNPLINVPYICFNELYVYQATPLNKQILYNREYEIVSDTSHIGCQNFTLFDLLNQTSITYSI